MIGEKVNVTAVVVRRFVERGLLVDLGATSDGTLHHPGQVDQVCRCEDLAELVAADTPLGPEQAADRLGARRVEFGHMVRLGWVRSPQSVEVRFGTSRAGAVGVALCTTASVDAIRCDPGEAKTDARDAAVIADAARTLPHTLRSLNLTDEVTAELTMPVGFGQDLAGEANRTSDRIRGLLTRSPQPRTRPRPPPGPPSRHLAPRAPRIPADTFARQAAAGSSRSPARGHRAWPSGSSTTSSPRSTSRPPSSPAPAPAPWT